VYAIPAATGEPDHEDRDAAHVHKGGPNEDRGGEREPHCPFYFSGFDEPAGDDAGEPLAVVCVRALNRVVVVVREVGAT